MAYFSPGLYDVTLTVSDGTVDHTVTFEDYIQVDETPEQPATPAGEDFVCINFVWQSDYTTAGSSNASAYLWELTPVEAGSISGTGLTGQVEWNQGFTGILGAEVPLGLIRRFTVRRRRYSLHANGHVLVVCSSSPWTDVR